MWHPAPSWTAASLWELQKDPCLLTQPGNPSGSNAASHLPGSHQTPRLCTHPWGPLAPSKVTWKHATVSTILHTKTGPAWFHQFAGQQSYLFPTALGTRACRTCARYAVLWAQTFFRMCCITSFTLLTSRLLWTTKLHITPFIQSVTFDNLATATSASF